MCAALDLTDHIDRTPGIIAILSSSKHAAVNAAEISI